MVDFMSMPALFIVLIVLLGLVTVGIFVGIRILGVRERPPRTPEPREDLPQGRR